MLVDEEEPRKRPPRLQPPVLDLMGVEELGDYIGELQAEIVRVQAEIARKAQHRSAADAFFRKP